MRELELKPLRFGEVVFKTVEPKYSKRTTNSDVLPEFRMEGRKLVVIIQDGSQQLSRRYGWAWVHTNLQCPEPCGKETKYGCTTPCEKALDFSQDRDVIKISGSIFFNNKYGYHDLEFVYFAVIKKNSEGVPTLYVRRRPAKEPFVSMSAEEYKQKYVAKNKHVKNSFCICLYRPPQVQKAERAVEV